MENKKQSNEREREERAKANRILYLVIALILCLGAAIAGIAASVTSGRRAKPVGGTDTPAVTTGSETAPVTEGQKDAAAKPEDRVPTFSAPLSGRIFRAHDLTVPVYSVTLDEYRVHNGVDILSEAGSDVKAMASGIVTEITDHPLLGHSVAVLHAGNLVSVYRNLMPEEIDGLAVGASVNAGQVIGHVGDSALVECCDEPHLHLEMTLSGVSVDPLDYVPEESIAASLTDDAAFEG
jgi:murein DD-endopeptidase MepM/ murein hydrolase activator NlpD